MIEKFCVFSSAYRIFHQLQPSKNGGSHLRVAIFHILATCLDAKGGCNGGEYGDDYFEDFTPDSFVFVFHDSIVFILQIQNCLPLLLPSCT
jgi:hypothetical protein